MRTGSDEPHVVRMGGAAAADTSNPKGAADKGHHYPAPSNIQQPSAHGDHAGNHQHPVLSVQRSTSAGLEADLESHSEVGFISRNVSIGGSNKGCATLDR